MSQEERKMAAPKPMGVTEAAVQFSCGMNWETIPADVMEMCKL